MPDIISFVSPKGGCGATFVCAGVWQNMAGLDKKVLAVDLCGGKCTLDFATGMQNDSIYDISDVISQNCSIEDAVCISAKNPNAHFLRGCDYNCNLSGFYKLVSNTDYDFVLLDIPSNEFNIIKEFDGNIKTIVVTDCSQISAKICNKYINELDSDSAFAIINKIIPQFIENGIYPTIDEILDDIGINPIGLISWSFSAIFSMANGIENGINDVALENAFCNICLRLIGKNIPAIDFDKININFDNKKFLKRNRR